VLGSAGWRSLSGGKSEVALKDVYFDKKRIAKKYISYKALIA
jgi:hypothetical protein